MTVDDERQLEGLEPVFRGTATGTLGRRTLLEPERRLVPSLAVFSRR